MFTSLHARQHLGLVGPQIRIAEQLSDGLLQGRKLLRRNRNR
jgi:hypothetical protein